MLALHVGVRLWKRRRLRGRDDGETGENHEPFEINVQVRLEDVVRTAMGGNGAGEDVVDDVVDVTK